MSAPTTSLSTYLGTLRRYLHDPNDQYFSQADKTAYLNQGIQQRDLDTGGNRSLFTFVTTAGVDNYTFDQLSGSSSNTIVDVVAINLLYNSLRVVLDQLSFTMLNARVRTYSPPFQFAPCGWSRYGSNTVYLAPAPSLAYSIEVDAVIVAPPTTLTALTDTDPLLYPYTDPVPYYAAYLAKLNERQYDEADDFKNKYDMACLKAAAGRVGLLPTAYPTSLVGRSP